MSRRLTFASMVLAAAASFTLFADDAAAARDESLMGSELIKDVEDVYSYPQLVTEYSNIIRFEYGESSLSTGNQNGGGNQGGGNQGGGNQGPSFDQNFTGNGLFLFGGESWAAGFAVHRGDLAGTSMATSSPQSASGGAMPVPGVTSFPYGPVPGADGKVWSTPVSDQTPDDLVGGDPPSNQQGLLGAPRRPHTVFDLFGGLEVGNGSLGARLSLATGGQAQKAPDDSPQSEGQFFALLDTGYTGQFDALELDTSLSISFGNATYRDFDAEEEVGSGTSFSIGGEGRMYYALNDDLELGGLLDIGLSTVNATDSRNDESTTSRSHTFVTQVGVGPVYTLGGDEGESSDASSDQQSSGMMMSESDESGGESSSEESEGEDDGDKDWSRNATISGYTVLGVASTGINPDTENEDNHTTITNTMLPGFHLAAEVQLLKWLYFRSGAEYWFERVATSSAVEDEQQDSKTGADLSRFAWSAGFGFEAGRFRFDGALKRGFMLNGPAFVSGNSPGLFGVASAQYQW